LQNCYSGINVALKQKKTQNNTLVVTDFKVRPSDLPLKSHIWNAISFLLP